MSWPMTKDYLYQNFYDLFWICIVLGKNRISETEMLLVINNKLVSIHDFLKTPSNMLYFIPNQNYNPTALPNVSPCGNKAPKMM